METWGSEVSKEPCGLSQVVGSFLIWMTLLSAATCFCHKVGLVDFFQTRGVPVRSAHALQRQTRIKDTVASTSEPQEIPCASLHSFYKLTESTLRETWEAQR